jgi:hypothetical protein
MSEQSKPKEVNIPDWRVVLMLGTTSLEGVADSLRIETFPFLAAAYGYITADENLRITPVNGERMYFADWKLNRMKGPMALGDAVRYTTALLADGEPEEESKEEPEEDPTKVGIIAAKMARHTFSGRIIDPNLLWRRIPDFTDSIGEQSAMELLGNNVSVEDFM